MNDSESDSQWKIYAPNPSSLAIVSTFQRIQESIVDSKIISGSEVLYYDTDKHITSDGNAYYSAIHKRRAFSHEKEFRLICSELQLLSEQGTPEGISVDIDILKLVDRIVISPLAEEWMVKMIGELIKRYGFNFKYSKSDLFDPFEI